MRGAGTSRASRGLRATALATSLVLGCDERAPDASPAPLASASPAGSALSAAPSGPVVKLPFVAPPAPAPWVFRPLAGPPPLALPDGCVRRGPILTAAAPPVRWTVEPGTPGAIAITDVAQDTAASAVFVLDAKGLVTATRPLPWTAEDGLLHVARAGDGSWLAAVSVASSGPPRVGLLRAGALELVGEGDGFEPVDLACGAAGCALLTTREGRVTAPGADVRVGSAASPVSAWRRFEIAAPEGARSAQPFAVGFGPGAPVAALYDGAEVTFHELGPAGAREVSRMPAPHGLLDVAMSPPLALAHGAAIDEHGCTIEPPTLRIERAAGEAVTIPLVAAPGGGALRKLDRGLFAAWVAPVGCKSERHVVYAVLLAPDGSLVGKPLAIGDGTSFGVAASGADVDVWLRVGAEVMWLRGTCAAG